MNPLEVPDHGLDTFGVAPALTHVRAAPERRPPAPGPAGAGDIRAQKGAGALAVLAENAVTGGPDAVLSAEQTAAAPGLGAAGGTGVHFSGAGTAELGFGAAPGSTAAALAGAARTSGPAPAQEGSRGWLEYGGVSVPSSAPPSATPAKVGPAKAV